MKPFLVVPIAAIVCAAGCTWVKPTGGGDAVRVAYDGNVTGCRDAGSISVSVADKVAFAQVIQIGRDHQLTFLQSVEDLDAVLALQPQLDWLLVHPILFVHHQQ